MLLLQIECGILCNFEMHSVFGNVVEENLWSAIQAQAQEDAVAVPFGVRQVMQTWTSKKGYPVVTVNRNYENGRAVVSQVSFILTLFLLSIHKSLYFFFFSRNDSF